MSKSQATRCLLRGKSSLKFRCRRLQPARQQWKMPSRCPQPSIMMFSEGTQLKEDFVFDKATGVKLHTNMFEYKKPTIMDIGPVESHLLETRAGNAAYGANGISHSLANTHAIICAIQNAIGKWVDPPATPDRILKALGKA
jgi:hypothetical protein